MNLSNLHFDQEIERSDTIFDIEMKIKPILESEFRRFFLLGMAESDRTTNNHLRTLLANVKNEALSDADFRNLAESIISVMLE